MLNQSRLIDHLARQRVAELHDAASRKRLARSGTCLPRTRVYAARDRARHAPRPGRDACYQSRDQRCRALMPAQDTDASSEPRPMSDTGSADTKTSAARATQPSREIAEPKAMRALAHPVRLDVLDAMRNEGELTATRAAELLKQSPGNMSWHLQTLAKYGFIVEAEGGKGRSRPWKIAPGSNGSARRDSTWIG